MKTTAGAVLVAGTLLFAVPALAQYYPSQPAPPPTPGSGSPGGGNSRPAFENVGYTTNSRHRSVI